MPASYPDAHRWEAIEPSLRFSQARLEVTLYRPVRYIAPLVNATVLLLTLAALAMPARAQTTITGRILDGDGTPVSYANVQLLVAADSSFARGTIADVEGIFTLEAVTPGAYRLFVSLIGYQAYVSDELIITHHQEWRDIQVTLLQQAIALQEVTVEARRAFYEQQGDRLVIHVGTSVTLSGTTALDVLKRSPGVLVNEQAGTISMMGKDGVRVMIGGKLSYSPAEGLAQYLAGISADNIERIELITSPPANLDAEGKAGFINIVMKRHPEDGLDGSMTVSGGYGKGAVGSASADISYQRRRISLYGTSSFFWSGQRQFATNFRRVVGTDGIMEMPTVTWRDPVWRNLDARAGIDYRLNGQTTVGALVAAYDNRWSMTALNSLTVKTDGHPVTRIDSDNEDINRWRHVMGNLNVRHRPDSASTFSVDLDYLYYHDDNPTGYRNTSTEIASGRTTQERLQSGKITPFRILVAKADYSTVVREKWALGAGVKGAFSRFTNRTSFEHLGQEEAMAHVGLGSTSRLREDVLAVYGHATVQLSASGALQVGLRYELTDSNLSSDEEDLVDRRFGSLFPTASYTHTLGDAHQVGVSYT
ncbi:MAG: outer membrane beta-barrel protein, partial [Xanthomonadales bacterium]|nr:outer membrane beta-barrel protein [Xanthomonadales bacterium]